jgi:hypothetical protein
LAVPVGRNDEVRGVGLRVPSRRVNSSSESGQASGHIG